MQHPRPFQPHSPPPGGNPGFSNSSFRSWIGAEFSMLVSEGTSPPGQDPWDSSKASQSCQQPLPLPSTLLSPPASGPLSVKDDLVFSSVPWLAWPQCWGSFPGGL